MIAHAKAEPSIPNGGISSRLSPMLKTRAERLTTMFNRLRPIWLSSTDDGAPTDSATAPPASRSTTTVAAPKSSPKSRSTATGTAISPARTGKLRRALHSTMPT